MDDVALGEPNLPENLTAAEWREALRACKGMALRSEVYGLDGSDKEAIPYSIAQNTCEIKLIQPKQNIQYASFQIIDSESLALQLDRNPDDPRISHNLVLQTDSYGNPLLSAVVGYPRQGEDPTLPIELRNEQAKTHIIISQAEFTNDNFGLFGGFNIEEPNDTTYRLPVTWKATSYELSGAANPQIKIYIRDESIEAFNDAQSVGFENQDTTGLIKRQLTQSETRFINTTLDGSLPPAEPSPLGITWQTYQLAFTPSLLQSVYGTKIDTGSFEGGYHDLNADGNWWAPTGTPIFEANAAALRFYTPAGTRDPFGNSSFIDFDDYILLPFSSRDALQNQVLAFNDYRTLSPQFVRDPNLNWVDVETDELGMVVKSAIMGKVIGLTEGEKPTAEATSEGDNLEYPSAELSYAFYDPTSNVPAFVYRKTLYIKTLLSR